MKKIIMSIALAVSMFGTETVCSVGESLYNFDISKTEIVDLNDNNMVYLKTSNKINKNKVNVYTYENRQETLAMLIDTDTLLKNELVDFYIMNSTDTYKGLCATKQWIESNK